MLPAHFSNSKGTPENIVIYVNDNSYLNIIFSKSHQNSGANIVYFE
jgi:hypothetical protein